MDRLAEKARQRVYFQLCGSVCGADMAGIWADVAADNMREYGWPMAMSVVATAKSFEAFKAGQSH